MTMRLVPDDQTTLEAAAQRFGLDAQALERIRVRLDRARHQRGIDRTGQALYPLDAVKGAILKELADQYAQRRLAAA